MNTKRAYITALSMILAFLVGRWGAGMIEAELHKAAVILHALGLVLLVATYNIVGNDDA